MQHHLATILPDLSSAISNEWMSQSCGDTDKEHDHELITNCTLANEPFESAVLVAVGNYQLEIILKNVKLS